MPVLFAALAAAMAACARSTVPIGVAARSKRSNTFAVLSSRPTLARSTASSGEWKGRAVCARCARLCASSAEITSAGALALGYSWVNSAVMSASISQSSSSQSLFSGAGGGRGRGRCGAADSTSLCIGGRPPDDDGGRLGGAGVSLWYGGRPAGRVARPRRRRDLDARRAPPGVPRPHIKRCDEATDADADIARAGSRGRRRRLECEDPRDRAFARSLAGETKGRARARVGVRKGARGINVSLCC
eukprot:30951-Pelagococcus_subviridis.AAC.2